MLKKHNPLIIIFIILCIGIYFLSYNYIQDKKIKIYNHINLLLYEEEIPEYINNNTNIEYEYNDNQLDTNITDTDNSNSSNTTDSNKVNIQNTYNILNIPNKVITKQIKKYYIGKIIIPKINLEQGFVDINSRYNNVHYNITIINTSNMPDINNGNFILAAHSGNCSVCYFDKLYKLTLDDIVEVYYNNIKYIYKLTNIYTQEKTGSVTIHRNYDINTITLITCTNNDEFTQTIYIGELINTEEI